METIYTRNEAQSIAPSCKKMASKVHDPIKEFNAVKRVRQGPVAHPQDARSTHSFSYRVDYLERGRKELMRGEERRELGGNISWSHKIIRICGV